MFPEERFLLVARRADASIGNLARLLQYPGSLSNWTHASLSIPGEYLYMLRRRRQRCMPVPLHVGWHQASNACEYTEMLEMLACCTRRLGRRRLHLMPSFRQATAARVSTVPTCPWAEHGSKRATRRKHQSEGTSSSTTAQPADGTWWRSGGGV